MPDVPAVTRDAILGALTTALQPLAFVDAMWEGGAAAFDRLDEWSDIDLYIVAGDDRVPDTFQAVEEALTRLSPIQLKYEPTWPPESGITQAFYRLERSSEYLLVDLAVLKRSAPDKFLEPELHGQAVFAFNKGDAVKLPHLDIDKFVAKLLERRDRLAARVDLFGPFLAKEIQRGNRLGAFEVYQRILLDALIQVLRMRYHPAHYLFSVRYVPFELPTEVVRRIEALSYVRSMDDLPRMGRQVRDWFHETLRAVNEEQVRETFRAAAHPNARTRSWRSE